VAIYMASRASRFAELAAQLSLDSAAPRDGCGIPMRDTVPRGVPLRMAAEPTALVIVCRDSRGASV
jgi:hypothetical protein